MTPIAKASGLHGKSPSPRAQPPDLSHPSDVLIRSLNPTPELQDRIAASPAASRSQWNRAILRASSRKPMASQKQTRRKPAASLLANQKPQQTPLCKPKTTKNYFAPHFPASQPFPSPPIFLSQNFSDIMPFSSVTPNRHDHPTLPNTFYRTPIPHSKTRSLLESPTPPPSPYSHPRGCQTRSH